ncbi:MAG TPA: LacI family DNA-binding transcriptional regulator [Jatrophihabitans sp.]|jgi:DNA-binding LacI/PurR family transcriptional regulator|nr:LacI family DNA-binding transcriptional regulator [Jatrophihabitans sp.]
MNSASMSPPPPTQGGRNLPTLEEVAARAGVSRATASRVLRGASNVSAQARSAVLTAAEDISYAPNRAARSLVTGRSDSVAFLVAESEDRLFSDPFFLGMLRAAQTVIAEAGLQLVFTVASSPEEHRRFLHYAAGGHVDGVLVLSLHGRDQLPQELESHAVPAVLSGRPLIGGDQLYFVDSDNAGGARMATEHLLAAGRRRIATITGPLDMCAGQDRLAGYRAALAAAGRRWDAGMVAHGRFSIASGQQAMAELLAARPDLDAVFAASDLTAIGAMRAIEAAGRRIYDDVAVVGFDDIGDAELAHPALTTIRQPITDMGRAMATRLLQRIAGEPAPRRTILPVELIRRLTA